MELKRFASSLIYSNVFVATVLACLTQSSYGLLHYTDLKWYVPLSVWLGSFVLYSFHRLYKIDFIPENQLEARHRWVLKRSEYMKYAMSFAVFLLLLILPNFNADTIVWLVPAGIISVGYTVPVIPSRNGWQRFRDIPLTKPLIIAVVVSYLTLGFPLFEDGGIGSLFTDGHFPLLAERCIFLLAVTIPFEMRDILNDRDAGLATLGTQLGWVKARRIALLVASVWVALVIVRGIVIGDTWLTFFPPIMVGLPLLLALTRVRAAWSDVRYTVVFESLILLYALCNYLLSI
jgi:hypothetical protein